MSDHVVVASEVTAEPKAAGFVTSIKLKGKETLNLVVLFCVQCRARVTQLYHKLETEKQITMCFVLIYYP